MGRSHGSGGGLEQSWSVWSGLGVSTTGPESENFGQENRNQWTLRLSILIRSYKGCTINRLGRCEVVTFGSLKAFSEWFFRGSFWGVLY